MLDYRVIKRSYAAEPSDYIVQIGTNNKWFDTTKYKTEDEALDVLNRFKDRQVIDEEVIEIVKRSS